MHFAEFTHADDVQPNLDLLAEMAAGEIEHFQMDKRFIRKDGGISGPAVTNPSLGFASRGART